MGDLFSALLASIKGVLLQIPLLGDMIRRVPQILDRLIAYFARHPFMAPFVEFFRTLAASGARVREEIAALQRQATALGG